MKALLAFDQQVGDLSGRDLHPDMRKPGPDLGLGHLAGKGEDQRQGMDPRAKLAAIAGRELSQIAALRRGRVELLLAEQDVVGVYDELLESTYHSP